MALALTAYRDRRPLVLGIPPGGAVIAEVVARELGGDLDVTLVRMLAAPGGSFPSIGVIAESGGTILEPGWDRLATPSTLQAEREEALAQLRRLREGYTPQSGPIDPKGRLTLLVDDGASSAAYLTAVLLSLRASGAEMLVAASAVASIEAMEQLRREADVVICLRTLEPFGSASAYYDHFEEPSERQIQDFLRRASRKPLHRGIA